MKTVFNWLITLAMIATLGQNAAAQQDPSNVGFVRVVPVLTTGTGKIHIVIDSQDIYLNGYEPGQKTGGIGLKAGTHSITLRKTGIRSAITPFTVNREETLTLIGYAVKEPTQSPNDPPRWKTRILPLKSNDTTSGYDLTMISLCQQDEIKVQAAIPNTPIPQITHIKHLRPSHLNLGHSRTEVAIQINGERITSIPLEDPGNYIVVIYEDETGTIQTLSFYNPKLATAG